MPAQTATETLVQRIWPPVAIAFGVGLTGIWVAALGYGFFKLLGAAF